MWCVSELDDEFIERMEDLLDLYEKEYDSNEPVVCLDERPVQLHAEKRPATAVRPGKIGRYDYEYVRKGTANVFCVVEPLAGCHVIKATATRNGAEFAQMLREVSRKYPLAITIHLVMDNLNTHTENTLKTHLGPRRGARLWNRFTVHYTPKHGSWLNQAEIEIGIFNRQCLGRRRIPTLRKLRNESSAWEARANAERITIEWRFTKKDARETFNY